jgi:5'-3' exoribonuclease 1
MLNTFPARERAFILRLAEELHLSLRWDEFDENDTNILTWALPGVEDGDDGGGYDNGGEKETNGADSSGVDIVDENPGVPQDSEWEDTSGDDEDDEESRIAVDRVLTKYERAPVFDDEADGGFEARYERSIQEKMDEWKRGYYQVRLYAKTEPYFKLTFVDCV